MYKRNAQGWLKHVDFALLDLACLQISFLLGYFIRHQGLAYSSQLYRGLAIVLTLIDIVALVSLNPMHNVLKRGYLLEFIETCKHVLVVIGLSSVFLFLMKFGADYSRLVILYTTIIYLVLSYLVRILWKKHINSVQIPENRKDTLLAVLEPSTADIFLKRFKNTPMDNYRIVGIVLTKDVPETEINGIPVVCKLDEASDYICQKWIDAVFIDSPMTDPRIRKLMDDCHQMALPVHYHVPSITAEGAKQFVEKVGGSTVLTTTVNYATPTDLFIKRCIDILGGLIGSFFALIIMAIVGPKIKKASPGPILFRQERIGKNGKRFKLLKLRSMYVNADEKKKELMEQNRVKDGMMFKMDFDPRIIGNEILPDGTKKTGIGEFIRRTSLDEFPQFFNVLKGEMSLVGTRPPTVDEWEKYEYHHRARLAIKPGITGMWQVSGRSEITDFEEVVKLDTKYITEWHLGLDIRILLKTIGVLFTKEGAM